MAEVYAPSYQAVRTILSRRAPAQFRYVSLGQVHEVDLFTAIAIVHVHTHGDEFTKAKIERLCRGGPLGFHKLEVFALAVMDSARPVHLH